MSENQKAASIADFQDDLVTGCVDALGEHDKETLEAIADAAQPQDGWLPSMIRDYLHAWRESGERP